VTDPGNLKDGIPNSGYCVKHNEEKCKTFSVLYKGDFILY
jgi:hypothetical protein